MNGRVSACPSVCGCVRAGQGVRGRAHVCVGMFWEWGNPPPQLSHFIDHMKVCVLKCLDMLGRVWGVCGRVRACADAYCCLLACAGVCGRVHAGVFACVGVCMLVRACVRGVRACAGVCGCVRACAGVCGRVRACAGMFWELGETFPPPLNFLTL